MGNLGYLRSREQLCERGSMGRNRRQISTRRERVCGVPAAEFNVLLEVICRRVSRRPGISEDDARDAVQEAALRLVSEWSVGGRAQSNEARHGMEWASAQLWRWAMNVARASKRTELRRLKLGKLSARGVEVASEATQSLEAGEAGVQSLLSETLAVQCVCARAVAERSIAAICLEVGRSRADVYRLIEEGKRELRQRAASTLLGRY